MIKEGFITNEDQSLISKEVFNNYFPWFTQTTSWTRQGNEINDSLLTHILLRRPEERNKNEYYCSPIFESIEKIIHRYTNHKEIFRMCFNFTYDNGHEKTGIHKDHKYDYKQFILYLTDNFKKGETVILNKNKRTIKKIKPIKNKYVMFGANYHYNYFPKKGTRVVLIATYR
jgi:hypothetical protein|tara:strand:- start:34 stop:549 length:516 start_codon:yes stop_codon:yes gene_type:complete